MKRGDQFDWNGCPAEVRRVAHDQSWVDLRCGRKPNQWGKRMKLPLPQTFQPVATDEDDRWNSGAIW